MKEDKKDSENDIKEEEKEEKEGKEEKSDLIRATYYYDEKQYFVDDSYYDQ